MKVRRFALSVAVALGAALLVGAAPVDAAAPKPVEATAPKPAGPSAPFDAANPTGHRPTEPSLVGSAQLLRLDGQDVRFQFDVHGFATDAKGMFGFSHRAGDQYGWAKLEADCLITGGPVAVVTGFITETNLPELKGKRKACRSTTTGGTTGSVTAGPSRTTWTCRNV